MGLHDKLPASHETALPSSLHRRSVGRRRAVEAPHHPEPGHAREGRRGRRGHGGGRAPRLQCRRRRSAPLAKTSGHRARPAPPRRRPTHARRPRPPLRAPHARGRQAAHREPRRGRVVRGLLRLLRRGRAQLARQLDPAGGRAPDQLHHQGAARRRRGDRAVQLSAPAHGLEGRARARRRQHRRHQAVAS